MNGRTVAEDMAARHGEPPEWPCQFCGKFIDCCSCSFRASDVVAAMRKLDAAVPRWIPVAERLPESGETVLVWHYGEVQMAWLNHFTNGVAYFVRDTHYNFEPTHWMPLPPPPAGD